MWISKVKYNSLIREKEQSAAALRESAHRIGTLVEENAQLTHENQLAQKAIADLQKKNQELEMKKSDPRSVIEAIMSKDIEWYNWEELAEPQKKQYATEAEMILRTEVFKNETNYLISSWAKYCLQNAADYQGVYAMRMSANGLQLLTERLEEIFNPKKKEPSVEEVYNAI